MYTKILNFKCHTNEQRSNKYTNQTLKPYLKCLCLYIILCQKCNLQVQSTNSSITVSNLVFWPCQHVRLYECAIMIVCLVCPRPLLFCSIALVASKQKKSVHMVRIPLAWLVECGGFRESLDNNLGRPKWKHRLWRMACL